MNCILRPTFGSTAVCLLTVSTEHTVITEAMLLTVSLDACQCSVSTTGQDAQVKCKQPSTCSGIVISVRETAGHGRAVGPRPQGLLPKAHNCKVLPCKMKLIETQRTRVLLH
eukprot:COSAG06_NODE_1176_length_10405_cov_6045.623751_10_plen_112_part_00